MTKWIAARMVNAPKKVMMVKIVAKRMTERLIAARMVNVPRKVIMAKIAVKRMTERWIAAKMVNVPRKAMMVKIATETTGAIKRMVVDSAASNVGTTSPRHYYGADMQLKFNNGQNRFTELRAEFITGTQTGTANSPETPVALLTGTDGFHQRHFTGAYFYFLQHLFSTQHQLVIKYDWYDPNSKVKGNEIGAPGSNFTAANIRYNTLGLGYLYYVTENIKLVLYYARVWNDKTLFTGYTTDVKVNVFTCRLQYRF